MLPNALSLLPTPRRLDYVTGACHLSARRLIVLDGQRPGALWFSAARFQRSLSSRLCLSWEIIASPAVSSSQVGLALKITPETGLPAQGYELQIAPRQISVAAPDEAGVFYGVCTLIQIVEQCGAYLPCLSVKDWPDFPARGVMLDVSRDKVPTMETLYTLVDLLAGWKINQLQLYTEHTFAYRQHPEVWAKASPLTGQEILELDAYCKERSVELVPNQNSFGHLHRWLTHPRYAPLAEVQGNFMAPWGPAEGPFSLCPGDPGSFQLVKSLYDELLPHFSSQMVNVGCDETFDLGEGRSKAECEKRGAGRVYLDFLLQIYQDLNNRHKTMQFWGDIILHHPELIPELPKDVIALEWGYEANHPFEQHAQQFAASGIPFYVCPGTSSWNSIAGRTANTLGNLLNAAESGIKYGTVGYLITDWGDNGHWQTLPVSYLGFAAGAAYSWALDANRSLDIQQALDRHAFRDWAGVMGHLAYDLGNVYKEIGVSWENTSALSLILLHSLEEVRAQPERSRLSFDVALEAIDRDVLTIGQAKMDRQDGGLILKEFELAARMLGHACKRGMLAAGSVEAKQVGQWCAELDADLQEIIADYTDIWLERNRPGGLADSVARLEKSRMDYQLRGRQE